MDVMADLRDHPRFAVRGWGVWVEWRDGGRGCETLADLVNISAGGALAFATASPGFGQHVTLRIVGLEPPAPIPAVVVATREGRLGHQLHFEFREPCPAAILEAVAGKRP